MDKVVASKAHIKAIDCNQVIAFKVGINCNLVVNCRRELIVCNQQSANRKLLAVGILVAFDFNITSYIPDSIVIVSTF